MGIENLSTYERSAMYLKQSGYDIAEIGRDPAHYLGIGTNYYGRLALHDTVRLMSECDLYIGMDGGLMHFAQSIHMPALLFLDVLALILEFMTGVSRRLCGKIQMSFLAQAVITVEVHPENLQNVIGITYIV